MTQPHSSWTVNATCRQFCWAVLTMLVAASGCELPEDLETTYGKRSGFGSEKSVNGTSVLSDLITARGRRVETRRVLSPSLREAQVIVWFPDSFSAPSEEVCDWFNEWLSDGVDRTLVYVGRDFDAAPLYWKKISSLAKTDIAQKVARRKSQSERIAEMDRSGKIEPEDCYWFSLSTKSKSRQAKSLTGPWSDDIDADKTEIVLNGEFTPVSEAEPLLESGDDIIVSSYSSDSWQGGQIILIENGSFLLNFALVNREHRKLASKLVDELDYDNVVFLESGKAGLKVLDHDPAPVMGNGLEILHVWPLNAILLHLAVLGIIFCFARFPIFGTPRRPAVAAASDFGLHIDALGELLAATKNRAHAEERLAHYRELRGDSR